MATRGGLRWLTVSFLAYLATEAATHKWKLCNYNYMCTDGCRTIVLGL